MNVKVKAKFKLDEDTYYTRIDGLWINYRYRIKGVMSGKGGFILLKRGAGEGQDAFLKRIANHISTNKPEIKERLKARITSDIESSGNKKLVKKLMKDNLSFEFEYKKSL